MSFLCQVRFVRQAAIYNVLKSRFCCNSIVKFPQTNDVLWKRFQLDLNHCRIVLFILLFSNIEPVRLYDEIFIC